MTPRKFVAREEIEAIQWSGLELSDLDGEWFQYVLDKLDYLAKGDWIVRSNDGKFCLLDDYNFQRWYKEG